MSRMDVVPRRNYRHIVFLCQECGGDLEPRRVAVSALCTWECQECRLLWTYTEAGWARLLP